MPVQGRGRRRGAVTPASFGGGGGVGQVQLGVGLRGVLELVVGNAGVERGELVPSVNSRAPVSAYKPGVALWHGEGAKERCHIDAHQRETWIGRRIWSGLAYRRGNPVMNCSFCVEIGTVIEHNMVGLGKGFSNGIGRGESWLFIGHICWAWG